MNQHENACVSAMSKQNVNCSANSHCQLYANTARAYSVVCNHLTSFLWYVLRTVQLSNVFFSFAFSKEASDLMPLWEANKMLRHAAYLF